MPTLENALSQMSSFIPKYAHINTVVSQAPVGWHIAHSCLVIISVVEALKKSNPADYQWNFSLAHAYVAITGRFPRGRGKAPDRVVPREEINADVLNDLSDKAKNAIHHIGGLERNVHFKHPYFLMLNKKATIRFLEIHTRHHVNIILDILA